MLSFKYVRVLAFGTVLRQSYMGFLDINIYLITYVGIKK
jgi:hypothetical protein